MTQCWWIRHAPLYPAGEKPACYIGQSDLPALLPAHPAKLSLPDNALWFSSPLQRALHTARWLHLTADIKLVPELQEQSFGVWEGRSYDDVWREAEHRYDWSKPEEVRPEGGESFVDVCTRVESWLERMADYQRPLVIVAHAGSIRAGLRYAQKLSYAQALALDIGYLSIHRTVIPALRGDLGPQILQSELP